MRYLLKKISFLLPVFFLLSCSELQVIHLNDNTRTPIKNEGVVFFLPQTELEITITETTQKPALSPYKKNINDLFPEDVDLPQQETNITAVSLQTHLIPDTSEYYLITQDLPNISLTESGIIAGINTSSTMIEPTGTSQKTITQNNQNSLNYNHLFIKRNTTIRVDTTYRTIKMDSVVLRKPVYSERKVRKTRKDITEDIYRYLIKVRKRRLRLIAGIDTVARSADALKLMLHHLDSLETVLYELLAGKSSTSTKTYVFKIIPTPSHLTDTLAFWDSKKGLNQEHIGIPLVVSLHLSATPHRPNFDEGHGFPYRIPKTATAMLSLGNRKLTETTIHLLQLGQRYYLPVKSISKKRITFSPSGTLIEINNN